MTKIWPFLPLLDYLGLNIVHLTIVKVSPLQKFILIWHIIIKQKKECYQKNGIESNNLPKLASTTIPSFQLGFKQNFLRLKKKKSLLALFSWDVCIHQLEKGEARKKQILLALKIDTPINFRQITSTLYKMGKQLLLFSQGRCIFRVS